MKICKPCELLRQNFNPIFINSLKQYWHTKRSFSCLGAPKRQNLFLYLYGFRMTYTDKSGNTLVANSGELVYTPLGSEYRTELHPTGDGEAYTVGVNFRLLDERGEEILLSEGIEVFGGVGSLPMLIKGLIRHGGEENRTQSRILLMEIINAIATREGESRVDERILSAVNYLCEHIEENPAVSYLAGLCNISEVYFRRIFKESLGSTPSEYRNALRLERASAYLEYGEISVQEISDALGYSSVSHFIKEFKRFSGVSPLRYRKKSAK